MRTGHAVNLYLSDETLKKLEKIIETWDWKNYSSKSRVITALILNEYDSCLKVVKPKEEK